MWRSDADTRYMKRRAALRRTLDLVVVSCALACIGAPLLGASHAESLLQTPVTVDVTVRPTATLTHFISDSHFAVKSSGRADGLLAWQIDTASDDGYKLSLSTDQRPALRGGGLSASDYSDAPAAWTQSTGDRRFGFSVRGDDADGSFRQGTLWRGFDGTSNISVARRSKGPAGAERTDVLVRSDMGTAWPSGTALPHAHIVSTLTVNL